MKKFLYIAWIQALIATLGSLYYSDIQHFSPCVLCWYQRILLYPLTIIIPLGLLRKDTHLPYLLLPLSGLGTLVALYQYLLQLGILKENLSPCMFGVSCVTKYVEYFGFITIPLLSLTAFVIISVSLYLAMKQKSL